MESDQATRMDKIKEVVRSSEEAHELDKKYLKKAKGYIGRNVVNITISWNNRPKTLNNENLGRL